MERDSQWRFHCRDPHLNRHDSPNKNDVRSITPELVRRIILESQSLGWKPQGHGAQFDVRFVAANLQDPAEKMVQPVMFAGNVHAATSGIPMTLNTA